MRSSPAGDEQIERRDRWTRVQKERKMDRGKNGREEGQVGKMMSRMMEIQMGRMDRRKDEWMDRWTEGRRVHR